MKKRTFLRSLAVAAPAVLVGCKPGGGFQVPPILLNDATITAAVSVATSTALRLSITDAARRTLVANYIEGGYGNAIRSITGNPTPENFLIQINAFIPDSVKQQLPELVTFVNPIALWAFQMVYNAYQGNVTAIAQKLSDFATGLQNGASQFASHPSPTP